MATDQTKSCFANFVAFLTLPHLAVSYRFVDSRLKEHASCGRRCFEQYSRSAVCHSVNQHLPVHAFWWSGEEYNRDLT